jgi:hypothetical protein
MKTGAARIFARFCYVIVGLLAGVSIGIGIAQENHSITGTNQAMMGLVKQNYIRGCIEAFRVSFDEAPLEQAEECRTRGKDIADKMLQFIEDNKPVEFSEMAFTPPKRLSSSKPSVTKPKKRPAKNTRFPEVA